MDSGERSGRSHIRSLRCSCCSVSSRRSCAGPRRRIPGRPRCCSRDCCSISSSDLSTDITLLQFGWGSTNWTDVIYVLAYVVIVCALARYYAKPPVIATESDDATRSQPFTLPAVRQRRRLLRSARRGRRAPLARAHERARHRRHRDHRAGGHSPDRGGARERAIALRAVEARERGALRGAGAALVRRHHDRRSGHGHSLRESHRDADLRAHAQRARREATLRSRASGRCAAHARLLHLRDAAGRSHRTGGMADAAPRRRLARRRGDRHESARRADGARHRAQHARHQRAQGAPGRAHAPGVPRHAHRARESRALSRSRDARARARAPALAHDRRDLPRSRQLQDRQRLARPRAGRHAADSHVASGCRPRCARRTRSRASAATSSRSSSRMRRTTMRP